MTLSEPGSASAAPRVFEGYSGLIEQLGRYRGEVARIDATTKSLDRSHLRPRIPVVVRGLMEDWPAKEKWTFDFFRREYGHIQVPTGLAFEKKSYQPLGEYIDYLESYEGEGSGSPPIYMEGWYFRAHNEELCADFEVPRCVRNDWFERWFPKRKNPKGTGILMGPKGAFTKLHTDGQCTHTWLAQFVGRKRWILVDYRFLSDLFRTKAECNGLYEGFEHPGLEAHLKANDVEYWTCNLEPGEIVVLPGNWFHEVTSLDATISLTHNFFNGTNARQVLWEMTRSRMDRGMMGG